MNPKNWNWKKILSITAIVAVVAVLLLVAFIKILLPDILKDRLKEKLENTFNDYYSISFDDIKTSVSFSGDLSIQFINPVFTSDTADAKGSAKFPIIFFQAEELAISEIPFSDILYEDRVNIKNIILSQPELKFLSNQGHEIEKEEIKSNFNNKEVLSVIHINLLQLEGGVFEMANLKSPKVIRYKGSDINLKVTEFSANTDNLHDIFHTTHAFKDVNFLMKHAFLSPLGSDYTYEMDNLNIDYEKKSISMESTKINPNEKMKELSEKAEYRKSIVDISVDAINIENLNFDSLIIVNKVLASSVILSHPEINMYRNHEKPLDKSEHKNSLYDFLNLSTLPLDIDSLVCSKASFKAMVETKKSEDANQLNIEELDIRIGPVQTEALNSDTIRLNIAGKLFGKADIIFQSAYPTGEKHYNIFEGNIQSISFSEFNELFWEFNEMEFTSGIINYIYFSGTADAQSSEGKVYMSYNDLKIASYDSDNGKKGDEKFFKTKLGNLIVDNSKNSNDDSENVPFEFTKPEYKGYAIVYLGGIVQGIKKTILGEKGAKLMPSQFE